jgi:hypothetical protein
MIIHIPFTQAVRLKSLLLKLGQPPPFTTCIDPC